MATNVTRFMNYRLTTRNLFYTRSIDTSRSNQTLLVPESNPDNEHRFRSTIYSNFNKSRAVTAKTARSSQMHEINSEQEAEGEGNADGEGEGEPSHAHGIDVGMNTNGYSTYGVHRGDYIAKYKMGSDKDYVGDRKLMEQESTNSVNTRTTLFFFSCIMLLCIGCAVASYISFTIDEDAVLSIFIMVLVAIPLDMFIFRVIICACITLFLKLTAKKN